jgi:hypothetical protein
MMDRPQLPGFFPLLLAGALLLGCAEPQRPYQFSTAPMAREPIDALAAALTQFGQTPVVVDPQTGTLHTRWVDTGVHLGQVQNRDATLVRRYTATLVRGSFGNEVTVSADVKRCVLRDFVLTEIDVQGTCQALERLPQPQRQELIRLGQRIEQAMAIP